MGNFYVGLDLGQAQDYTALTVVEKHAHRTEVKNRISEEIDGLHVRHLERFELGTLYPTIVDKVCEMLRQPLLRGAPLIIDATGVGRPVCDMFNAAGLKPVRVLVTAGDSINQEGGYWRVPKRDLVGAVQAPLQVKTLKFADSLPLGPTLVQEMINFKVKITTAANDTYGAWREGQHDDLIFAVMLACWWAARDRPRQVARSYNGGTGEEHGDNIIRITSAARQP